MIAIIDMAETSRRTSAEMLRHLLGPAGRKDEGLLGLELKPHERKGKATREATLLTLREDLASIWKKLLDGAGRTALLRDLDYTIDQLDNVLGEM